MDENQRSVDEGDAAASLSQLSLRAHNELHEEPAPSCSSSPPPRITPDAALLRAATDNSQEGIAMALAMGATSVDAAMHAALARGCTAALYLLLQRGALARTIGVMPSLLHRPGLQLDQRVRAAELLLAYVAKEHSAAAYRASVRDMLLAGAAMREGPLLLAALVRSGHLEAAYGLGGGEAQQQACTGAGAGDGQDTTDISDPAPADAYDAAPAWQSERSAALHEALKLNEKARRASWSTAFNAQDAVVCGLVRTPIRRRYSGYELARQQLQLCLERLNAAPWSPRVHHHYPRAFRELVRTVLLCASRPPLNSLPEGVLLLTIERLARAAYWETPPLQLDEGAEVDFRAHAHERRLGTQEQAALGTRAAHGGAATAPARATSNRSSGSLCASHGASSAAGGGKVGGGRFWTQRSPSYYAGK